MILKNFNQYITESKDKSELFDTVKKGDVVMYAGARFKVKDVNPDGAHELEAVKAKAGEKPNKVKLNRAQFNQKCREINE
jgi:hypothetical protein